jgi:hypothetical protein
MLPAEDSSNRETIPDTIRRPQRGEAPRYPQDMIIGVIGQGEATEGAYRFARNLLTAVLSKKQNAPVLSSLGDGVLKDLFEALESINPQKFRFGGGREEPDGSTSFLVRFIGREQWITGELYLRFEEEQWQFEDLILEEPRDILKGIGEYRFDFSPYERFY